MHSASGAYWNNEKDGMVSIVGVHFSSFGANFEPRDMSYGCLLCRHVPKLNSSRPIGNADSEFVV